MITNLVILNPEHLLEDGEPNPSGLVYQNAIVIHPIFRDKLYKALLDTFEPDNPPIVISHSEYLRMVKYSKGIRTAVDQAKKEFIEGEYTLWWGQILKRALEEADDYIRSSTKSESTETPAVDVPEVK